MGEIDSNYDEQLAALYEINDSLRQQIIELALSIAAMRETADLTSGVVAGRMRSASRDQGKMARSFDSAKSATVLKMPGQR